MGGGAHSHSQTVEVTVSSIWKVFWQIPQYLTVILKPLENYTTAQAADEVIHMLNAATAVLKHHKAARQVCYLHLILTHLNLCSMTPTSYFVQKLCLPLFLHQNVESLCSTSLFVHSKRLMSAFLLFNSVIWKCLSVELLFCAPALMSHVLFYCAN